jgi:dihydrofolate synthase/folylpolyglutamate synthase
VLLGIAFLWFEEQAVNWVVLECSVGGTSSSTNYVDAQIAIITSIGLDHCHMLGETVEEIATNKAGII